MATAKNKKKTKITPDQVKPVLVVVLTMRSFNVRRKASTTAIEVRADKKLLSLHKKILDCEAHRAIEAHDNNTREILERRFSLPNKMSRRGVYWIAADLYETASTWLAERREQRQELVELFLGEYAENKEATRQRLDQLGSHTDYPSVDEVRARYAFDWWVESQVGTTAAALEAVNAKLFQEERSKVAAQWAEAISDVRASMAEGFQELLATMTRQLSDKVDGGTRFYASTVDHLDEFLDFFEPRNVTNDTELAALVGKCRTLMRGGESAFDAKALRSDGVVRTSVLTGLQELGTQLGTLVKVRRRAITVS